jgi:hypothetical protein
MTDVPVWVAVITAGAGIIGAAIPQVTIILRDVRQAGRDRRERAAAATRDACVELLRAAAELRILAEGVGSYRGDANGLLTRVDEAKGKADAALLYATSVGMQAPGKLAAPAEEVAIAASGLADQVVQNTDLSRGVPTGNPDSTALTRCINSFRRAAVDYFRNNLRR